MASLYYQNKGGFFFEFDHSLWDMITPNKHVLVKIRQKNLILGRSALKKYMTNLKNALILVL